MGTKGAILAADLELADVLRAGRDSMLNPVDPGPHPPGLTGRGARNKVP
jgi:hypothetical protein